MGKQLDICRQVYNDLLAEISDRKKRGLKYSKTLTQNLLPKWKKKNPELNLVYSKVLQMVNYQLWSNIKCLSISKQNGNRIGRLRYETSQNSMKTLNYNQSGFKIDETSNKIRFSKIGWIRTIIHRPIPEDGKVKGIIIKRAGTGKWFAIVQIEKEFDDLPATGREVGIDMGISSFITDSDKTRFEYPNNIDKTLDKIRKYQRAYEVIAGKIFC